MGKIACLGTGHHALPVVSFPRIRSSAGGPRLGQGQGFAHLADDVVRPIMHVVPGHADDVPTSVNQSVLAHAIVNELCWILVEGHAVHLEHDHRRGEDEVANLIRPPAS